MTSENSQNGGTDMPPEPAQSVGGSPVGLDQQLLTTRELMSFLNLSRTKIWEMVKKENLPAFKLGGDYRYRRSEVIVWLENYRVTHGSDGTGSGNN
jgi:excisionase family DNA binding protein